MPYAVKGPQLLNVGPKAVRGLPVLMVPEAVQFALFELTPEAESMLAPLKPGAEVKVSVELQGIPTDVNFTAVSAVLTVQEQKGTQPAALTQVSRVTKNNTTTTYSVALDVPPLPTNLTVRLEGSEVFWSFTGPSAAGSHSLPDLAEEANAYLDRLKAEKGEIEPPITLPFLIQSDNAATVTIAINSLEYSRLKTQSWDNELDGTTRVDRNLQLDFAALQELPLDPIDGAAEQSVVLRKVTMDVGGELGPERMLGQRAAHDGRAFTTISSDYSLAQGFTLATAIQCVGVHGLFANDSEAEIYVELQSDREGSPADGEPLAQCNLSLAAPEPGSSPQWTFARFDAPADLQEDVAYWLVIKGIQGKVLLALQAQAQTYLATSLVNRGGQLWKPLCPAARALLPLLRLVYLPEIDNQSAAVTLSLKNTTVRQPLDPTAEVQSVTLSIPTATVRRSAVLVVESQAQGTLSIANVVQEYLPE
jgi:hypothetical protein